MNYFGEHLLPGRLGNFFITLSLLASLIACFAYFKSVRSATGANKERWKKLARTAFLTETISVFAVRHFILYHQ
jgi:cytochrome c-type biogenesis protein CcmF